MMRLLPPSHNRDGWTHYVWLIYLLPFAAMPFMVHASALERALTLAATAAGAALYFTGYWLRGRQELWVIGAFLLLGTLFAKDSPAAGVMVIYGACLTGQIGEPSIAFWYLGGLMAVVGLESWLLGLPMQFWLSSTFFGSIMGAVTIHFAQRRRLDAKLLIAHEEVKHLAKVAERERIARDLHDLLGHTLSLIVLKAELASRLTSTDPERAAAEIRDVERISRDALAQVRSAVRGYRSAGFGSELAEARKALESAGIEVEASVDAQPLSPVQEGVFALALREAVTNVVRHAHATACRLRLAHRDGYCELEVADNGRGGASVEGNGLRGMRERVEALGGVLERECANGTLLRIRVPL